jgi:hypothetical protein
MLKLEMLDQSNKMSGVAKFDDATITWFVAFMFPEDLVKLNIVVDDCDIDTHDTLQDISIECLSAVLDLREAFDAWDKDGQDFVIPISMALHRIERDK